MKSKYLGMISGAWQCTHVGVASVQPVYKKYEKDPLGRRVKSKSPGSKQYYYIFERPTSDGKAMKMVRLSAAEALRVRTGLSAVEQIADRKKSCVKPNFTQKVSYSFHD